MENMIFIITILVITLLIILIVGGFSYLLLRFLFSYAFKVPTIQVNNFKLVDSKLLLFITWFYCFLGIGILLFSSYFIVVILGSSFIFVVTMYVILNACNYKIFYDDQKIIFYNLMRTKKEVKYEDIVSFSFSTIFNRLNIKANNGITIHADITLTGFYSFLIHLKEKINKDVDLSSFKKVDAFFRFFRLNPNSNTKAIDLNNRDYN